ncbi:MAG: hypothetical protein EBT47_06400 [Chloroflexi bacterium]|nr:hypothetical protein [Chloroflexota bacterium]
MREPGHRVGTRRAPEAFGRTRCVVGWPPQAVHVRHHAQLVGMCTDRPGNVVVVVRIVVVVPRTNDHRASDMVLFHFEQQLLHLPTACRVRDWRVIWPEAPSVAVAIDDHPDISSSDSPTGRKPGPYAALWPTRPPRGTMGLTFHPDS